MSATRPKKGATKRAAPDGPGIIDALAGLAVPIDSIELLDGNPNRGNVKAVAASLRRFGQRKPVVVRADDRQVTAGNTTLEAARSLGWPEIAAVFVDEAVAESVAFALADNRTAQVGAGYDEELLADQLRLVAGDEELLAATAWTSAEVARLTGLDAPLALNDRDDVPKVERRKRPKSKVGDVWELGPHRLVVGDSTSGATYRLLLGKELVDAVWTDPPYGVEVEGAAGTIENDDLEVAELERLIDAAFTRSLHVCRPGGAWYVACPMGPTMPAFTGPLLALGIWRQTIVWVKDSLVLGRSDYHYRHEGVMYGWAPGGEPDPLPERTDGLEVADPDLGPEYRDRADGLIYGWAPGAAHHPPPDRRQDTVWEIPRPKRNRDHPTMKPADLVIRGLRNSTDLDAVVLDPFAGSGTTLIACHHTGRVARLIELDPHYADAICRRWQEHTGVLPIRKKVPVSFVSKAAG